MAGLSWNLVVSGSKDPEPKPNVYLSKVTSHAPPAHRRWTCPRAPRLALHVGTHHCKRVCDCVNACYKRGSSYANFVYMFKTPSKHRSCTLYSNFNLPPSVTIGFNKTSSVDITEIGQSSLPAQAGSLVPHCTKDGSTGHDPKCISGALWALDDGKYIC